MNLKNCRICVCLTCIVTTIGFYVIYNYVYTLNQENFTSLSTNASASLETIARSQGNQKTKLIIVNAYMRTGSSYLGRLIGHHQNAFYFYEPLHKMIGWNYVQENKLCEYIKPTCTENSTLRNMSLDVLEDILTCRLTSHTAKFGRIHTNQNEIYGGFKWTKYNDCMKSTSNIQKCWSVMENECNNSTYKVTKVLRMSLEDVVLLFDRIPDLKIIQLFRDPRGIINSHIIASWHPVELHSMTAIEQDVEANCKRINRDILAAQRLVKKYPDRLKIVQYEDIEGNISKLKRLFAFIGMKWTLKVNEIINKENDKNESKMFNRAFAYRKTLPYNIVKLIDKHCEQAIKLLGLRIYSSEQQLKDASVSSIVNYLTFALE